MLFDLDDEITALTPLEPIELSSLGKKEKHLEDLLASHLLTTLFEGAPLLPFHQERNRQAEADIYALDAEGNIVVFELKRSIAGIAALEQLMRYTQEAAGWNCEDLDARYQNYPDDSLPDCQIAKAHQEAFGLTEPLKPEQFNRHQKMVVVGSAADTDLISAVDFWRRKGLDIDFVPFRIYRIGEKLHFEMFAKPYDQRTIGRKGVIFDTNSSYDENSIWEMIEEKKVAAYGGARFQIGYLSKGDYVFLYHRGRGIVAGAEVTGSKVVKLEDKEEWYLKVRFLTSPPVKPEFGEVVSVKEIRQITSRNFFWAKTVKVPYLPWNEAENLMKEVQKRIGNP